MFMFFFGNWDLVFGSVRFWHIYFFLTGQDGIFVIYK